MLVKFIGRINKLRQLQFGRILEGKVEFAHIQTAMEADNV